MTGSTPAAAGGLVTLGETLALLGPTGRGPLAQTDTLALGIGGAESNVAVGVRRLGVPAAWVGRVGRDPLGDRIVRELRAEDLDVRAVRDDEGPTALMLKERRTADRTRVWYHRRGSAGSHLDPGDLPEGLVEQAAVLHVTGITPGLSGSARETVRVAVSRARAAGVPVSFDVNHRDAVWGDTDPRPVYAELAAAAAVVFAGDDEARRVTGAGGPSVEELLAALADHTDGDVVLKRGAQGCSARVDGERVDLPAVPVTVVDTVGAGDAFVAGYLADLVAGRPARERLVTATRAGAFVCGCDGDWEGLPGRADLVRLGAGGDPVLR